MPKTYETCPCCGRLTSAGKIRLQRDHLRLQQGYDTDRFAVGDQLGAAFYPLWPRLPRPGRYARLLAVR